MSVMRLSRILASILSASPMRYINPVGRAVASDYSAINCGGWLTLLQTPPIHNGGRFYANIYEANPIDTIDSDFFIFLQENRL